MLKKLSKPPACFDGAVVMSVAWHLGDTSSVPLGVASHNVPFTLFNLFLKQFPESLTAGHFACFQL